jgi:hypothetical protein
VPVAEVIPGMIDTRIPPKLPVVTERKQDFLVFVSREGSIIFCFGITGFVIREVIKVGVPKRPESAGNRTGDERPIGESTGTSKIKSPKKPERMKTNKAKSIPAIEEETPFFLKMSIFAFSVPIIRIEIAIKTNSIISLNVS